jgi:hypothetical protein
MWSSFKVRTGTMALSCEEYVATLCSINGGGFLRWPIDLQFKKINLFY